MDRSPTIQDKHGIHCELMDRTISNLFVSRNMFYSVILNIFFFKVKIHKVALHQLWVFMQTYNICRGNISFQFDVKFSFTLVFISLFCILLKVRCQHFSCFSCYCYRDIFEENGYKVKLTLIIFPKDPEIFNAV